MHATVLRAAHVGVSAKRLLAIFCAAWWLAGCVSEQRWTFRNGEGLGDARPPVIIAEVYAGAECGFRCTPRGTRAYCAEVTGDRPAPRPTGLTAGDTYCFIGTALDDEGQAFAVGCASATIGGPPVEVILSQLDENRFIARQCTGALADAGLAEDGGTGRDAGTLVGTPVAVEFAVEGSGALYIREATRGTALGPQPLFPPTVRTVEASVGLQVRLEALPGPDSTFVRFDGGPCGETNPCTFAFDRNERITARFQ